MDNQEKQIDSDVSRCIRVLFVCMGNICRSPTAEGVFRHLVEQSDLLPEFEIDSAGTHAYHVGDSPDPRSQAKAAEYGVDLSSQRARRVTESDFREFDYILAMDSDNLSALERIRPEDASANLSLLLSHGPDHGYAEVPDPYYGGARGFELVYQLVYDACQGLLQKLSAPR
ncbi:MAG: low molecular weight protein-tyrosine-phosphatase [Pseudomonadota bacterium]